MSAVARRQHRPVYLPRGCGAVFSDPPVSGAAPTYRYKLWRTWCDRKPFPLVFVLLNPSVADGNIDDPTVRKCVGFADALSYDNIVIVNAFALRSTDPRALFGPVNRIGPDNFRWLKNECAGRDVLVGWGRWGGHRGLIGAIDQVRKEIKAAKPASVFCLGYTKDGQPRHPLMLSYDTPLEEFAL